MGKAARLTANEFAVCALRGRRTYYRRRASFSIFSPVIAFTRRPQSFCIIDELHRQLSRRGPVMLQSHVPDLVGELAKRLCEVVDLMQHSASFWADALGLARRALNV